MEESGAVYHFRQASCRDDISRMHQPIQMSRGLLDRLAHIILAVEVEDISDEIEGILVILDFCVEACEVEAVGEVFFVDLAEVFVAARGDELQENGVS